MNKLLNTRSFINFLEDHSCTVEQRTKHSIVYCPCGEHLSTIGTGHKTIAPGAFRTIKSTFTCVEFKT